MTEPDATFEPPFFSFVLPSLRNPRTTGVTGAFEVAIYDSRGRVLYSWDSSNSTYAFTVNGYASRRVDRGPAV